MSLLETAVAWLAPVDCIICGHEGQSLCEMCEAGELLPHGERCGKCGRLSPNCKTCEHCRPGMPSYIWLSTDYSGAAQKLLQAYKFQHQRAARTPIVRVMNATLDYFQPDSLTYMVVPVPTATSRVRSRSFDHSLLIAKALARERSWQCLPLLRRLGQARQLGAKRPDRLSQQAGAYYAPFPEKVKGKNILLIDDVITTGATLQVCTKVLRQAGARRVDALVFAKRI